MKKLLLTLTALTLMVSTAGAVVLHDQSATRADFAGFWNSESPGMWGGGLIFAASDFTIGQPAIVESITTYYTNTGAWAPGTYPAIFDIYAKTGSTPVTGIDDPLIAAVIDVTIADIGNGVLSLTATGLEVLLGAGEYWVLLSPTAPQGMIGIPEFQIGYDGAVMGDPSCWIEFGGMFTPTWTPNGDALDGAILIEGYYGTVDTENSSLGSVKALYR